LFIIVCRSLLFIVLKATTQFAVCVRPSCESQFLAFTGAKASPQELVGVGIGDRELLTRRPSLMPRQLKERKAKEINLRRISGSTGHLDVQ
jgi:hypothetical protein